MRSVLIVLASSTILAAASGQDNWPQFRGPKGLGISEASGLPETWSANKNIAWRTGIPGYGWSSPIIWGDKVFLTSVVSDGKPEAPKKGLFLGGERPTPSSDVHHWMVFCIDLATGKQLWQTQVHEGRPPGPAHVKNTYASETPVTDGQKVYAYFGNVGVFCLDYEGKLTWSRRFGNFKTRAGWGTGASPALYRNRLYIVDDNEEQSFAVALDAKTGAELWRVPRDEKSNWSTPYIWENDQRTELVTAGRNRIRSYGLDGKLLWQLGGMSSICIPTPFAHQGLLYVSSGFVADRARPVFAIRPGASGDISLKGDETANEFIVWCQKTAGPYNPSPLAYGDYFYVLYDFGFLSCYDARTGKEVYGKQRINTQGTSGFTASPWAYHGKIFCLSEDGDTFVIRAGPEYELLGRNSLEEMSMATPAIAKKSLVLRTVGALYCLQVK